jgi:hypothetical protein
MLLSWSVVTINRLRSQPPLRSIQSTTAATASLNSTVSSISRPYCG